MGYSEDELYRIFTRFFWFVFRGRLDLEVVGIENVPESGPRLGAFNHINVMDVFVLPIAMLPHVMNAWVANKHIDLPFMAAFHAIDRAHPIKRGKRDKRALLWGINVLRGGRMLTISPDGTRNEDGILTPPDKVKLGAAYLAAKTDAVIIPIGINGTKQGLRRILNIFGPKVKVKVVVGEPFNISDYMKVPDADLGDKKAREDLRNVMVEMMKRIAALVEPWMRGEYQ
jgi:1-acyl-sn-glycerol-3-phosphate acyltransferase